MAPKEADGIDAITADLSKAQIAYTGKEHLEPIVYTEEELTAMKETLRILTEEHKIDKSRIGLKFLALVTIVAKNRPEKAAEKYKLFLEIAESCDLSGVDDDLFKEDAVKELDNYRVCGTDYEGRRINWVRGKGRVELEDERIHVEASLMYFLAVHADPVSLRKGIVFVLAPDKKGSAPKVGNEKKMRQLYMAFPMRPQHIYIEGTSVAMRLLVSAFMKLGSLVSSNKLYQRLEFLTEEQIMKRLPKESLPDYLGGPGGDVAEWVKKRVEKIPLPEL